MRTWGRIPATPENYTGDPSALVVNGEFPNGYIWVEVTTDANGFNASVWLTTLAQVLQLGLNESPMFGSYGIPAQQSVVTQVFPDYYVTLTQQAFAPYFLALILTKLPSLTPSYLVNATANPGAIMTNPVAI